MPYCVLDDVYQQLSAAAYVVLARPFESVDLPSGTTRLTAHGYAASDLILPTVTSGGTLPPELSALTYYSPLPIGSDLFQWAATQNGPPIQPFSTAGLGWGIKIDAARRINYHITDCASIIDEHMTANRPPILTDPISGKYPQILIGLNARMAARAAVNSLQIENAAYRVATDRLFAREAQDLLLLADWKAGKPLQPRPTDQDAFPDNAANAFSGRLPVNWATGKL